ncbi:MAG: hypothetical protein QM757_05985 [Paludibaculum sp.]
MSTALPAVTRPSTRWVQLVFGVLHDRECRTAELPFWALFTQPMTSSLGVSLPELQILVLPPDRDPDVPVAVAGRPHESIRSQSAAVGRRAGHRRQLGTGRSSVQPDRAVPCRTGLLGGIGTGIVYVGVIGHMVQWFPDKRGMATGFAAAGYGSAPC